MQTRFKAEEVHYWVADTFASGHWPVSRANLRGLRLKQVADAIKIFVATVYCRQLAGTAPPGMYARLKKGWVGVLLAFPRGFLRVEDWEKVEKVSDRAERCLVEERCWLNYYGKEANEEEREFLYGESFSGFINYLEALPRDYPQIMPHVLGHVSQGYIYLDDTIPVLSPEVIEEYSEAAERIRFVETISKAAAEIDKTEGTQIAAGLQSRNAV
jgi:hypothetical protein